MNKDRVIEAIKILIDECNSSSCDYCDFNREGNCILAVELGSSPCSIEIENLEECKNN